jgi:MYXO-CTERM domain-containing protein
MNRYRARFVLASFVTSIVACGDGDVGNDPTLGLVTAPLATPRTYTTNFPLTENPISEGGNWINGATTGLDWGDVSTTPGQTHDHSGAARYGDATALLTGSWLPDQMAQATVYAGNTFTYPEVELRLRSNLSAHKCTGYEITFSLSPNSYALIVRWNGPLGNFTILQQPTGSQYAVKAGDVVKATIVGNVITAYKNGMQMAQATDSTYATGNPGMGFNELTNGTYGYTSFSASEIVAGGGSGGNSGGAGGSGGGSSGGGGSGGKSGGAGGSSGGSGGRGGGGGGGNGGSGGGSGGTAGMMGSSAGSSNSGGAAGGPSGVTVGSAGHAVVDAGDLSSAGGTTGSSSSDMPGATNPEAPAGDNAGCACRAAGPTSSSSVGLVGLCVGLAVGAIRRRRR